MAGVGSRTFAASSRGVMHTSSVYSSTTLLVRLKKSLCRLKKPGGREGHVQLCGTIRSTAWGRDTHGEEAMWAGRGCLMRVGGRVGD